jgi:RNase P subunit RPR2
MARTKKASIKIPVKINTAICPVCKKLFVIAPQHIYKARIRRKKSKVCSWGCVRYWELNHKEKGKENESECS